MKKWTGQGKPAQMMQESKLRPMIKVIVTLMRRKSGRYLFSKVLFDSSLMMLMLQAMKATMPKVQGDDDDLLEDSDEEDDLPSDFGDSDELQGSDASENEKDDVDDEDAEEDQDDDGLSLVEASDNEDLISLDGDVPHGLDHDDSAKDEEWAGIHSGNDKKRKREEDRTGKRKKLRSLPTFASYEDYAKLIEEGPEDDI